MDFVIRTGVGALIGGALAYFLLDGKNAWWVGALGGAGAAAFGPMVSELVSQQIGKVQLQAATKRAA